MSETARAAVAQILETARIAYSVRYVGQTTQPSEPKPWECDEWRATIGGHEFPYFTGLGLREPIRRIPDGGPMPRTGSLMREELEKARKPIAPHVADVLHSLLLDSSAIETSFKDWCSDFGYSDDSIAAPNTYNECCAIGQKLRKMFTREQRKALQEALRDY
jgi:hypothetical protein